MSRQERIARYLAAVEQLPPAEQAIHDRIIRAWIATATANVNVTTVSLEDVPHVDQASIDSAFAQLMDGVL